MEFKVKDGNVNQAINRWKKWLKRSGLIEEIKDRQYFVSKSRRKYLKRRSPKKKTQ